jgi:hypothetical protein
LKTTDRRCAVAMQTVGLYGTAKATTSRHLAGEKAAWHDLESLRDGDAVTSLICTDYGYRCPRMPESLSVDRHGRHIWMCDESGPRQHAHDVFNCLQYRMPPSRVRRHGMISCDRVSSELAMVLLQSCNHYIMAIMAVHSCTPRSINYER